MRRLNGWVIALALACLSITAAGAYPEQDLRFGLRVGPEQWGAAADVLRAAPADPANPVGLTVHIPADWAESPDWPALDEILGAVRSAQARLCVTTALPGEPEAPDTLKYLATLSVHAGEGADALGLSIGPSAFSEALQTEPDRLALAVKRMTASLRGGSGARILVGEIAPEALPLLEPLYARDFRAYVEGYSSTTTGSAGEPSEAVVSFLQSYHLGAPLLLHLPRTTNPIAAQILVLASASRDVTYTDVEATDPASAWRGLLDLRARLSPGMAPGFGTMATEISDPEGPRPDVGLIHLLDADRMVQAMVLVPRVAGSRPGALRVLLPTADITDAVLYLLPGCERRDVGYTADQKKQETLLQVPWEGRPLLLSFNRLRTGTVGQEEVTVTSLYRLPVEVILARHQAVSQPQTIFLDDYVRDAQVDYHFRLPGGTGSLDVTFLNTFYFEKGVGARWVQNQLLVNGVAWKGKTLPELPIIEPEKVNTLPLELTLGRDYTYRYVRDEVVDGVKCFEVEFVPAEGAQGSLYTGKVWISQDGYQKIRMSVRQLGLKEPLVSSEETDSYAPYKAADGRSYWLLSRVRGQQIFSVVGQNVVGEREIRFGEPRMNDPGFRASMAEAEASDRRILQETGEGLKYLEKQPDGTRKIQMDPKTGRLFAAGGFYYDKSLDYPLPLVGINYFDYDYRKTNTQVNLLATGAVNSLSASKVNLFPKVDGSLNVVLFAIPFQDRFYRGGVEDEGQKVKILREFVSIGAGWRFQEFSKLSLELRGRYLGFSRSSDTSSGFVLPHDHMDWEADVSYDFSWKGWSLGSTYEMHKRSQWEPWGRPGRPKDVTAFEDYVQWSAAFSKAFYLPKFQKISASLSWLDGKDLDRFSRYEFTYLGRRSLSGFAGSGIRFDRGSIASLAYQFNLAQVVRFGFSLEHARIQPVKNLGEWQNHTGVSLSGSVAGPWQTLWTLDAGYALRSDVGPVERDYTVGLAILKLW
jgi:hypothetical protein